jgi:phosphate transport system protein
MARKLMDEALKELLTDIKKMSVQVDHAIEEAVESLKSRDLERSRAVVKNDRLINEMRFDIEERALRIVATQQPMGTDLRILAVILNVIGELERMGDYASGIGNISLKIGEEPPIKPLIDIPRMSEKARDMLRRSIDTLIDKNEEEARKICKEDDEVDQLYQQVYRELLSFMIEDPKLITRATYLLWAAHNLERIADRVTNICERTVFLIHGKMVEGLNISTY